uniref:Uncharacterized protein n=1 Tax=Anopheles melas TaxID=34690 RepID=A0A182UGF4_9DIPT
MCNVSVVVLVVGDLSPCSVKVFVHVIQLGRKVTSDLGPPGFYSISGTSTSLIPLQATGGPTCPATKSPCTIRQPRAAREKDSTASDSGAEPTTIRRSRPPKPS